LAPVQILKSSAAQFPPGAASRTVGLQRAALSSRPSPGHAPISQDLAGTSVRAPLEYFRATCQRIPETDSGRSLARFGRRPRARRHKFASPSPPRLLSARSPAAPVGAEELFQARDRALLSEDPQCRCDLCSR